MNGVILASTKQGIHMTFYAIRQVSTKRMIEAYEGEDCLQHATDMVNLHNKLYPNDQWVLIEENDE